MRMWMVEPEIMCRQHLLGEHVELHMMASSIAKCRNLQGFLKNGLCEPSSIIKRHEKIVVEMEERGYKHNKPLKNFMILTKELRNASVNREKSLSDLINRCSNCRKRYAEKRSIIIKVV
jgi:hypothetical protein